MIKFEITSAEKISEELVLYKNEIILGSTKNSDLILFLKTNQKNYANIFIKENQESEATLYIKPNLFDFFHLNDQVINTQTKLEINDCIVFQGQSLKLIAFEIKNPYIFTNSEIEDKTQKICENYPKLEDTLEFLKSITNNG
ncbi:hypothetical protein N9O57_01860 [bacterium]|nr:hypothetical protein [bacterium]